MKSYAPQSLSPSISCPCGRWEFRRLRVVAAPGFSAIEEPCPRCRHSYLLVFRITVGVKPRARFVRAVRLDGQNELAIRRALHGIPGLTADDVEFMLAVAVELAGPSSEAGAA